MTFRYSILRIAFALALVAGLTSAVAQSGFSIRGTVTDTTGAAVSGSSLELQSTTGSPIAQTLSTATGNFDLPDVPAGSYILSIPAANGFAAQSRPLRISASLSSLKIKLSPESVAQTIDVGNAPSLSTEAADNKDAVTVSGNDLQKLPVFDQDYVAALTPFLDSGSVSSGGATILVDGVEMKSSTVSPSAIAEVRINSDPYSAEFGRPGRGRINIITKPGSAEFHGTLDFIDRDAIFNAKNYFAPTRPPEQRRISEGHLTGPLGHGGHTTFLLSGDRRQDDTAVAVHAFGPQGLIASNVLAPRRDTQVSLSVAHDFSPAHRLSIGYNFEYGTRQNMGVGGIVLPEAGINTDSREDDLIFNDRIIITPNLLNQLQITLEKDEDVSRSVTNAPSLQIQDSFTGGGAQADLNRTENTVHINEIVSWTYKNHYIRFGFNGPQISRRAVDDQTNRLGTFNFNSLTDYTNSTAYVFTQQQGIGRGLYWANELAGFVQDDIKLTKDFQLTLGLRYQWQTYINSTNNFAPRISAAYSVDNKTILRAGTGMFFDRMGGDFPATFKLHNGIVLRSFQILNPGYPDPLPPGKPITALPSSIVRVGAQLHTPYTVQYSFDVERELTPAMTVTVGYRGITGISSFRSRDANAPLGPSYAARPDPSLGFVQQIESGGRSSSNALDVSFRGRAGRWFNGQAQYTLGRIDTNTGGLNFYPQDQYNPNDEWGRADIDRLHRFNLIGNINPDHWLTLGISATLYSGAPYTETAGSDLFHTGLGNARPAGVGRNTLQGGGTADLDLLWDHDFKLTNAKGDHARILNIGVSGFNVLNHANFTNYIGSIRSPLFGQPTAALAGRQLQFGIRYQF
jgi:hypothetical protein